MTWAVFTDGPLQTLAQIIDASPQLLQSGHWE